MAQYKVADVTDDFVEIGYANSWVEVVEIALEHYHSHRTQHDIIAIPYDKHTKQYNRSRAELVHVNKYQQ